MYFSNLFKLLYHCELITFVFLEHSITDELETVCGLLSPPKSPSGLLTPLGHRTEQNYTSPRRSRHYSEMSNPEMARYLEKETLRDAEDSDYQLMEGLIQRRLKSTDEDKFHNNAFFLATTPDLERYQVIYLLLCID